MLFLLNSPHVPRETYDYNAEDPPPKQVLIHAVSKSITTKGASIHGVSCWSPAPSCSSEANLTLSPSYHGQAHSLMEEIPTTIKL